MHAVIDRVPWLAYLMHKNRPSEVAELFMNAFLCATASEESYHMSKFGSWYAKVDFGQNESCVIIYIYCTCAKLVTAYLIFACIFGDPGD